MIAGPHRDDLTRTMRFDPAAGVIDIDDHLARLGDRARALGFAFDRHEVRNELQIATFRLEEPRLLELRLSPSGAVAILIRTPG